MKWWESWQWCIWYVCICPGANHNFATWPQADNSTAIVTASTWAVADPPDLWYTVLIYLRSPCPKQGDGVMKVWRQFAYFLIIFQAQRGVERKLRLRMARHLLLNTHHKGIQLFVPVNNESREERRVDLEEIGHGCTVGKPSLIHMLQIS